MHDGPTEANELALNATPHNEPTGRDTLERVTPRNNHTPEPTGNAVRLAASQTSQAQPLGVDHIEVRSFPTRPQAMISARQREPPGGLIFSLIRMRSSPQRCSDQCCSAVDLL
jgi:hypothetical protein